MFFTAHLLRSLEPQRTLRFFILLFSVERTENNKKQALRAFIVHNYRVAIDFFLLPSSQRKKKFISSLRSLRLCGEYFFYEDPFKGGCWLLGIVGQSGGLTFLH